MSRQDKNSERAFYDQLFSTRNRFDQFQNEIYGRVGKIARDKTSGTIALDVGCGSGTQAALISELGFSVVAMDLSLEAAKLTKQTLAASKQSSLSVNADAEILPIQDQSVDACICSLVLHHFSQLDIVAAELRRIIRPGGVVVAIDANGHNPFSWIFFNLVHRLRPIPGLTVNQRAIRRREIKRIFSKLGFTGFEFDSISSELRREWRGNSFGAKLNYISRDLVLRLTQLMPRIARGNILLSVFQMPENNGYQPKSAGEKQISHADPNNPRRV